MTKQAQFAQPGDERRALSMFYGSAGKSMLTLRTGCGDIIVMAARVVHHPAPLVGLCL